jgi:hypothetical protein
MLASVFYSSLACRHYRGVTNCATGWVWSLNGNGVAIASLHVIDLELEGSVLVWRNLVSNRWKWFTVSTTLICVWGAFGIYAVPNSLSGRYVTDSDLIVSPEFGTGTPQVFPLELRMNLTDANKSLKGGLVASTKTMPISFSFALTGERRDPMLRLKLEVGICLEFPSVTVDATLI